MKFTALFLSQSVLLCASVLADSNAQPPIFKQGDILPQEQYVPAYNAPAQVALKNHEGKWWPDVFVDVAFLYYRADQSGLDLASSAAIVNETGTYVTVLTSESKTLFQELDFKPDFKVGIGARFSNWTLSGEYTWIRQTTETHRSAPRSDLTGGIGVWILNDWYQQLSPAGQLITATHLHSKWHLAMDLADLMVSRPFYQARHLILSPTFGIRGAWIRQAIDLDITIPTEIVSSQVSSETPSRNTSHSWAVGPRVGLEANCLLGMGFRIQGELAASILFTQYTHVTHRENIASSGSIPSHTMTGYTNYDCLRAIGELGLGIGWGSYLCNQKYHIDFTASYDYMVFWNQNMIRTLLDSAINGVSASAGNLNLQGLTLMACFDF